MDEIDWGSFVGKVGGDQYVQRINLLREKGLETGAIEHTVDATIENLDQASNSSFVIYGEPQSGKTEMMIALNARLVDEGFDVIVNLLTDSVDLLAQSLARFRSAGLSPSPKLFSELPEEAQQLRGKQWVIFSKKNARDLEKLKITLRLLEKVLIIDDEADYASPNSKVNSKENERTKINHLIHDIINGRGHYIGVTATPARLDLNNTFSNKVEKWVHFEPHSAYVGQEFFFPSNGKAEYRLYQFEADEGNERLQLETAVLHFLCGVAEQHKKGHTKNFSMIVHTSGKIDEHFEDLGMVRKVIEILSNPSAARFNTVRSKLSKIAKDYGDWIEVTKFVLKNINRHQIVEINHKGKKLSKDGVSGLLSPTSLFSFGVGGNIISRGVTFENLLSMYFTRSVKGKFTQDTYIQRARMFGNRNNYKEDFQLWIPETLMSNWGKCFDFHKLALEAVKSGKGAPVWLADHKTTPTSNNSIDKSSVDFESGEMSYALFDFDDHQIATLMDSEPADSLKALDSLAQYLGTEAFPSYVLEFIRRDVERDALSVCFHAPAHFGKRANYTDDEISLIRRKKSIFSGTELARGARPTAKHHLKAYFNRHGKARLFYKINGSSVKFIRNVK